jgi:peptidoglycan/xylan/chitin deacetylase (PgdA/CDA1 family)
VTLEKRDVPGPRRDFVGYGPNPPPVRWPNDAAVAVSIVVNYEEGAERSKQFGDEHNEGMTEVAYTIPDQYRDLGAESMYEYGSRAGIWRLFRLFDEYGVKVTMYAAALALEQNPAVGAWIQRAGHEPCGHGWRWEEPWLLDRDEERRRIGLMVESITRTCGRRPVGVYHRYMPSIHTRELLVEEGGFLYDSDSYNDDLPYFVEVGGKRHLVVPYSLVYNDSRFIFAQGFSSPTDFVDQVKRAIDEYRREARAGFPKMMSIGVHARLFGQAGRISGLREVIEHALGLKDVWLATREEIARWWLDQSSEWNAAGSGRDRG